MLVAEDFYYIKYEGIENNYLVFGIGIDCQKTEYKFLVEISSIYSNGERIEYTYRTLPNRTDDEYKKNQDEYEAFFEKIKKYLHDVIMNGNYFKFERNFFVTE